MALDQYPLDKTFLVAAWLEALCYGGFFVVFWIGVYIHFGFRKGQSMHNKVMFVISCLMFIISTMHLSVDIFRLIRGYVDFRLAPGGPVGYIGQLNRWDHIMKDTLYATQSMVGDAAAIYRCWILWNRDYKIIALPASLLCITIGSGYYITDVLYPREDPNASIFDPRLLKFITLFYAIAVTQNIITTGLMSWRLWQGEHRLKGQRLGGSLMPILRILIESAALYLLVEILLLATYAVNYNVQYIVLETVTPIAGLTFSLITIRINLRSQKKLANMTTQIDGSNVQTIGSMPMRRIVIGRQVEQIDDMGSRFAKETRLSEDEAA
ncbi:hypothetical protein C8F04DRAFT_1063374 [Mycena alexandri]|uniref:Uncharacterized protein n=1 Tax=Mycena alexandri TaxID=1745969 RepID=A0AAD6TI53_9AGAR|nr:hypothetical protein C8F04DRAFT_1063374 [Mycena alexandri]